MLAREVRIAQGHRAASQQPKGSDHEATTPVATQSGTWGLRATISTVTALLALDAPLILPPLPLAQQSAAGVQLRHDAGISSHTVFGTLASRNGRATVQGQALTV
jgi:hypothetical protein